MHTKWPRTNYFRIILVITLAPIVNEKDEEDMIAWCLLEERENEQWQKVISKRERQKVKKANQASLLSVENSHKSDPKAVVEVKDRWLKVDVTMDSGAAGHVMLETMFPRIKLERNNGTKEICGRER